MKPKNQNFPSKTNQIPNINQNYEISEKSVILVKKKSFFTTRD